MIENPHLLFEKRAIVIYNLGGPDSTGGIKPFLFNLFYDPLIITLPNPFRWLLARFLSSRRTKTATEIYNLIGGSSPILGNTLKQADALQQRLPHVYWDETVRKNIEYRVFVGMRYTKPFAQDVMEELEDYSPDKIILLPLYPQYSTTTTESFTRVWNACRKNHPNLPFPHIIQTYFDHQDFISAHVDLLQKAIFEKQTKYGDQKFRILFSAHGLPQKTVDAGDPYQKEVEGTTKAVTSQFKNLDYILCYQSKVGPLKWLTPSTESEIEKAARDKVGVIVVPIAFTSEHSETLVELDIEYKELAHKHNVPFYIRVPALGVHPYYIACLAKLAMAVE